LSDLKKYNNLLTDYTELRLHENRTGEIRFLNGDCLSNSRSAVRGASARVFKNNSWGFASIPQSDAASIEKIVKTADYNAAFIGSRMQSKRKIARQLEQFEPVHDFSTKKKRWSSSELLEFIKEIDNYIAQKYPHLKSRSVSMNFLEMQKELLTSEKGHSYSMIPRTHIGVSLFTEQGVEPVDHYKLFGGFGQFEDHFSTPELLFAGIDRLYVELMQKKEAVFARAGECEVILAPELTGLLAHEAIGHTTEADLVIGGSVAGDYLNQQVGSELVSLTDFANTAYGQLCPQPIFVDDEGTIAKDAVIIEKGVLKGFMHNRESAALFDMTATGNARAYTFSDEPLIRMRNTAFLPGKSKIEEMIASVEDGYYLIDRGSGQADATSEFMFGVTFGYEIKNGQIGRAIKETTISGVAFNLLKTVSMASDQMEWANSGLCGKKQSMPTAKAGPAFKCKVHIGGRQ